MPCHDNLTSKKPIVRIELRERHALIARQNVFEDRTPLGVEVFRDIPPTKPMNAIDRWAFDNCAHIYAYAGSSLYVAPAANLPIAGKRDTPILAV